MAEPVTLTEAKAQCRMADDDSEDTFITSLIAPARAYIERVTRYYWVAASRTETFGAWGDYLEIYRRPIASVDSISYIDENGDTQTLTGTINQLTRFPVRIYPPVDDEFPDLLDPGGSITVTFTSGALDSASEEYLTGKRAMLLLIGFWFDNRGEVPIDDQTKFAIDCILGDLAPLSAY